MHAAEGLVNSVKPVCLSASAVKHTPVLYHLCVPLIAEGTAVYGCESTSVLLSSLGATSTGTII